MEKSSLKETFVPTAWESGAYLVFSCLFLAITNLGLILNRFSGDPITRESLTAEDYRGIFSFLTDIPFANTAVIVLFWSGVGLVAYTLVWALINAFIEARNEIVVESEYINKGRIWDRLRVPLIRTGLMGVAFGWLVINYQWFLPWLLKYFRELLITNSGWGLLTLVLPVMVLALDTAVAIFLFRAGAYSTNLLHAFGRQDTV